MIKLKIKVKNDHCSLTEDFECETITLEMGDPYFKSMVESVIEKFNQPVDEVIVKTRMEV